MRFIQYTLIVFLLSIFTVGCGGKDYTYQDSNEDNPGPGLLSGSDGEFHLIQKTKKEDVATDEDKTEEEKIDS
ncbi:MAG: hypothetical protein OCC45_16030 [Desulfotalea sp.]